MFIFLYVGINLCKKFDSWSYVGWEPSSLVNRCSGSVLFVYICTGPTASLNLGRARLRSEQSNHRLLRRQDLHTWDYIRGNSKRVYREKKSGVSWRMRYEDGIKLVQPDLIQPRDCSVCTTQSASPPHPIPPRHFSHGIDRWWEFSLATYPGKERVVDIKRMGPE